MHVLVDIKVAPPKARRHWTPSAANAFVDRAIEITGLKPFGERQVVERGDILTFFQFIAESHIAGHLDRHYGLGWVDVFSCKPVDTGPLMIALGQHLVRPADGHVEVHTLDRGLLP
jgi:hypothetical protein